MLQQTRVETVKGYYARFLRALPTLEALAACPQEQLLKLWEGLGYYNRARNLQKAAQQILQAHQGQFPQSYAQIRALAGIGDYTAGAICSICFGLPTPAVDGNVLRVFSRLTEDYTCIDSPAQHKAVRAALQAAYPQEAGDFTQALMELGATVCLPNTQPHCAQCPLQHCCEAHKAGSETLLPQRMQKKPKRHETYTVFLLTCQGKIALQKRPAQGLLAALWELPNCPGQLTNAQAMSAVTRMGAKTPVLQQELHRDHVFTHIVWQMVCYRIEVAECFAPLHWVTPAQLHSTHSLPTAFRQFLQA